MNIVIDTLRFSDKLKEAGFAERQADGLTRALSEELLEQLATKADIKALKDSLNARMDTLNARIDSISGRIDSLENRFNFLFALIGLLVVLELIPVVTPLFVG